MALSTKILLVFVGSVMVWWTIKLSVHFAMNYFYPTLAAY